MIKATMVVFVSETHLEIFEPIERHYEIMNEGVNYDSALRIAKRVAKAYGFDIVNEYSEFNEFGDPITCYFLERET